GGGLSRSLFLTVGLAVVVTGWRKTFPGGVVAETVGLLRRLPRQFYLALGGAALVVVTGLLILVDFGAVLGCWMLPVLILTFLGVVAMLRVAGHYGRGGGPSART